MDIVRPFRARRNNAGSFFEGFAYALLVRLAEYWAIPLFAVLAAVSAALVAADAIPRYLVPASYAAAAIAFAASVLRTRAVEGKTDWNHAFLLFSAGPVVLMLVGLLAD